LAPRQQCKHVEGRSIEAAVAVEARELAVRAEEREDAFETLDLGSAAADDPRRRRSIRVVEEQSR